ncbi:TetR/AcrR family transcriptional regulator [Microbacterium sp. SS28]|uniref:TetR/AcrR family transcriptional regulator n=1 Tax=Microbacterium sp. SS28 TaxID=2919948 RepID=UPI001FAA65C5|nr:TetR/AcrR family transcriptional regulator [Microbacterium sp. SS28]
MPARRAYAKGAAKREEILAVALDVVAKNGCRKATNREIAKRVGLTQPGLMHYFSSREELFQEVLRTRDQRDHALYNGPDAGFDGFLAVIRHNAQVPGLVQLYAEFAAEASIAGHPAHDFFVKRYRWVRGVVAQAIVLAQEQGLMGPDLDIAGAADLIVAATDGLQVEWLHDPSIDMTQRLTDLWQLLCRSSK